MNITYLLVAVCDSTWHFIEMETIRWMLHDFSTFWYCNGAFGEKKIEWKMSQIWLNNNVIGQKPTEEIHKIRRWTSQKNHPLTECVFVCVYLCSAFMLRTETYSTSNVLDRLFKRNVHEKGWMRTARFNECVYILLFSIDGTKPHLLQHCKVLVMIHRFKLHINYLIM